jgi:hypothetical protein
MDHSRLLLLATLLALAGCNTTPRWDAAFGQSVRQARAAQLIDPAAATRGPVPLGLDGKASAGVMRDYAEYYGYGPRDAKPVPVVHVNPR